MGLGFLPQVWNFLALVVLAVLPVVLFFWYVSIVSRRNKVNEAQSSVDVQLKQRLDLIPNILRIAQRFMDHEKNLLNQITQLRTQISQTRSGMTEVGEQHAMENLLSSKMGQLMVQVENYPELKSDQTMVQAMATYNEVESRIAASRRFFNAAVTSLNNAVQVFPGTLLARLAGVKAVTYFEAEPAIHKPVNADDYLSGHAQ